MAQINMAENGTEQAAGGGSSNGGLATLRMQKQLENVRQNFCAGMLSLIDMKSPQLGAHCRRVALWCREVGELCGLSSLDLEELEMAGLLHDLGFLVTAQKGPMLAMGKEEEKQPIRHPSAGYAALGRIAGYEKVAPAVLHHHEHFDGTGYPQKLYGGKIPLYARIIAVADCYDLELHPGAAIRAHDPEKARRVLAQERGKRLDPEITNKLLFVLTASDPVRRFNEREIEISPTALQPGMVLSRDLRSIHKVLLLKADTVLTQAMIDRFLSSDNEDWLVSLAYVDTSTIPEEELPTEVKREEMQAEPKAQPPSAPAPEEGKPLQAEVLIVDDSTAVFNALRRELTRTGVNVTGVTTVPAAVDELGKKQYEAVITDLVIGGMSGFDLLKEVSARYPFLHCVVLSGFPTPENIRALRGFNNVVRFVTKPWSQPVLLSSLREALEKTRTQLPSLQKK